MSYERFEEEGETRNVGENHFWNGKWYNAPVNKPLSAIWVLLDWNGIDLRVNIFVVLKFFLVLENFNFSSFEKY